MYFSEEGITNHKDGFYPKSSLARKTHIIAQYQLGRAGFFIDGGENHLAQDAFRSSNQRPAMTE